MASATSSGGAVRPRIRGNLAFRKMGGKGDGFGAALLGVLADAGGGRAGADGVHADAVATQFEGKLDGHGRLSGLGGGIGGGAGAGEGAVAVDRRDDHHRAALAAQVRHGEMQRHVGAPQVDADGPVPFVGRELVDRRPGAVDAGIGDQQVQPAGLVDQAVEGGGHGGFVGGVGGQRQRPAAGFGDVGADRRGPVRQQVQHADSGPVPRQPPGGRRADAGPRAGDQRDLALEFHPRSYQLVYEPSPRRRCGASQNSKLCARMRSSLTSTPRPGASGTG